MTPVFGTHDIPAESWAYNQRNSAFLGHRVLQRWIDFVVWEHVLDERRELKSVIELGTGNGMFSTYLAIQCAARDMQFQTLDHDGNLIVVGSALGLAVKLGVKFLQADVWNGMTVKHLINHMPHPLLLFCDDGDKPREFATFGPMLSSGDMIATHDWTEEFGPENAKPIEHLITPYFHAECEAAQSITRFWMIK